MTMLSGVMSSQVWPAEEGAIMAGTSPTVMAPVVVTCTQSERSGGSLGIGYVSTSGFLPINNDYRHLTLSSGLDYQPIEALKLAFSGRYSNSYVEVPPENAGDRFEALDPDQCQDRQHLVLALRSTHTITPWWGQDLLFGLNRIDSLGEGFSTAGFSVRGSIEIGF
jgi:hypothetical protein